MLCPRCETAVLEERERDGVTIDVCRGCRGIWLDRGELERLTARSHDDDDDDDALERRRAMPEVDEPRDGYRERFRYEKRRYDDDRHREGPRRKRSWLDTLSDVFD